MTSQLDCRVAGSPSAAVTTAGAAAAQQLALDQRVADLHRRVAQARERLRGGLGVALAVQRLGHEPAVVDPAQQHAIEVERGGGLAGGAVDDLAHRPGVGQAPDGRPDALQRVQPGDGALVDELAVQPAQLGVARIGVEGRGDRAVGGEDVLGAALQRAATRSRSSSSAPASATCGRVALIARA